MKYFTSLLFCVVIFFAACRQPKDLVYQGVQNFKLGKLGLSETSVAMDIQLYNPNGYDLKLKKADVDVFINDNHVGKMIVKGPYKITKMDTVLLPVTLNVDVKNVLPNAVQLLFNSNVNVRLTGTIKAGRHGAYLSVPINYEGKQDILSGMK